MEYTEKPTYDENPIDPHDLEMFRESEEIVKVMLKEGGQYETGELTDVHLDWAQRYLKYGTLFSRSKRNNATVLLGACYGQFMVREFGFEWINYKDADGEDPAIIHRDSNWIAFPFHSARKRVRSRTGTEYQHLVRSMVSAINEKLEGE